MGVAVAVCEMKRMPAGCPFLYWRSRSFLKLIAHNLSAAEARHYLRGLCAILVEFLVEGQNGELTNRLEEVVSRNCA